MNISDSFTYGARVTGAGWGGCIVALTSAEKVNEYKTALKREYYSKLGVSDAEFGNYVFVTTPRSGACVYDLKSISS